MLNRVPSASRKLDTTLHAASVFAGTQLDVVGGDRLVVVFFIEKA